VLMWDRVDRPSPAHETNRETVAAFRRQDPPGIASTPVCDIRTTM